MAEAGRGLIVKFKSVCVALALVVTACASTPSALACTHGEAKNLLTRFDRETKIRINRLDKTQATKAEIEESLRIMDQGFHFFQLYQEHKDEQMCTELRASAAVLGYDLE